jgi:hypothetical protein
MSYFTFELIINGHCVKNLNLCLLGSVSLFHLSLENPSLLTVTSAVVAHYNYESYAITG